MIMIDIVQMIIMVDDSPNDFGPNGLIQMRVLEMTSPNESFCSNIGRGLVLDQYCYKKTH